MEIIGLIAVFLVLCVMSCICCIAFFVYSNYSTISELREMNVVKDGDEEKLVNTVEVSKTVTSNKADINALKTKTASSDKSIDVVKGNLSNNAVYVFDANAKVYVTGEEGKSNFTTSGISRTLTTDKCIIYGYYDKSSGKAILSSNYFSIGDDVCKSKVKIDRIEAAGHTFRLTTEGSDRKLYPGQIISVKGDKFEVNNLNKDYSFVCEKIIKLIDVEFTAVLA